MAAVVADDRLSAYRIHRSIGRGSYGEVFLVTHRGDSKQYVMKNIKLTASAKERGAAEQEASLLSRLKHPNIVSYRESFQDSHCILHIVMGYCEGGDLATRLRRQEGSLLPEKQVVEWFVQIALALQYLHERNILHRDLKTQNIFLSRRDIIKVGDLGIARVLDGSCDLAKTVVGTPYYMSPELFSNQPYNHKSDVWALGCCVYEMATLKHPFSAHNINALMIKILKGEAPDLPQQFSPELSDLVQLMLCRDSSIRPSVNQLLRKEYVRTHIKLFLDVATSRRKKGSKGRRERESVAGEIEKASPTVRQEESHSPYLYGISSARERRRQHRQMARERKRQEKQMGEGGDGQVGERKREVGGGVGGAVTQQNREGCASSTSSSSVEEESGEGSKDVERGEEEEELFSLLDSTLQCVEADDEVTAKSEVALEPGRLQERIAVLRRECESELGVEVVSKALSFLNLIDPQTDANMKHLLPILGQKSHERFAPKIRQLWLCEDALIIIKS